MPFSRIILYLGDAYLCLFLQTSGTVYDITESLIYYEWSYSLKLRTKPSSKTIAIIEVEGMNAKLYKLWTAMKDEAFLDMVSKYGVEQIKIKWVVPNY